VRTFELPWRVFDELLAFWWGVDGSRMGRSGRIQMRGSCGLPGLGEYVAEWLMIRHLEKTGQETGVENQVKMVGLGTSVGK
jgi:hypothetical protein